MEKERQEKAAAYIRNANKRAAIAEKEARRRARMVKAQVDFSKMNTMKRKKKSKSPTQRNLLDENFMELDSIEASNLEDSSIERLMSVEGGVPSLKVSGL